MSFGSQLKVYRTSKELSQKQLADIIGCANTTISSYENGTNRPSFEDFIKICQKLKLDANYFFQEELKSIKMELPPDITQLKSKYDNLTDHDRAIVDYILNMKDTSSRDTQSSDNIVHLINMGEIIYIDTHPQPVSAGKGNIYIDDSPIPKLYPSTPISTKADYCVRVSGESMYPDFLDGDIVYVDNKTKDLNNGDIGIFVYNGEAYCKKYFEEENTKKLISLNPNQEKYGPIIIENDTLDVQGKVIGRFHAD